MKKPTKFATEKELKSYEKKHAKVHKKINAKDNEQDIKIKTVMKACKKR